MVVGCLLLIGLALLPRLLSSKGMLVGLINSYAGLAPLKVDLERVEAGWFRPVSAHGVRLIDAEGRAVLTVGSLQTEKGLFGWIANYSNLGVIRVANVEAEVVTFDGTSNIEQALQPLLGTAVPAAPATAAPAVSRTAMSGTVEMVDARFDVSARDQSQHWILTVPRLSMVLPRAGEVIGPVRLQAAMAAGSAAGTRSAAADNMFTTIPGSSVERSGTINAEVQQVAATAGGATAFELKAVVDHVPLDFWHVVRARVPELPIEALQGSISAKLAGTLVDANRWGVELQQFATSELSVVAPQLIGAQPARLSQIAVVGKCSLTDNRLTVDGAQMACDFGNAAASAQMPWPVVLPTVAQPWLAGATVDARGNIDLAKLVRTAGSLIPMRPDTQLMAGSAQFVVSQQNDAAGAPVSRASFELAGLQATAAGQQLTWNDPLKVELQAGADKDRRIQFGAICSAEFCKLQGQGTVESGSFNGEVNLDLLQQRISQWMDLPIRTMAGSATVQMQWAQTAAGIVQTQGKLVTTPLVIASKSGGDLREPAWDGTFSATTLLENHSPTQINTAELELNSEQERLVVNLLEPIRMVAVPQATPLNPARFTLQMTGDLAKWQQRGLAFQALPTDMSMRGNISLGVEGRLDQSHVEVLQASWRSQPFQLAMSSFQVAEPQMVGSFKGRVDTADLARLMVEKLEVQATSFSVGAADQASPDGQGREGRAAYLVDVGNLMTSLQGPSPQGKLVLPQGGQPPTQLSASGRMQGSLTWQVNPAKAAFNLESIGENITLENKTGAGSVVSRLWNEPQVKAGLKGQYDMRTGGLAMDAIRLETPWISYAGTLDYRTVQAEQTIAVKGQAIYDAAQVADRIRPWTGGQVQLVGQKTVPIDVVWKGKSNGVGSALAGLQAATRLGWDQARVVGIQIGTADVQVSVTNGQLATATEIPVSGGIVRWDVASDLTSSDMIIAQKPMVVLENVAITPEMCQSWLKYVTPLIADATSVEGRLSLKLDRAALNPVNPRNQTVVGQLLIHSAEVGPGPLSNQIIGLVQQIQAIRRQDFTQAVSNQKVWLKMPEQKIDFEMINGQVVHRNLNIHAGDVTISTSGTVDIDGRMELLAAMPIPDDWTEKSPLLAGLRGQSLQFPIRGTLTGPQLDTELLRQFGRQQVQQAASGLLQQGLSRGLEKLFGGQQPQLPIPGLQPPAQQPPVQGTPIQ